MHRTQNTGVYRLVGIALIVMALINVVPSLALFGTGNPPPTADNEAVGVEDESAVEDAIESTGGLTSLSGTATLILAPVMIAIGVALLMLRRWEMFAAIVLILDAFLKLTTLLGTVVGPENSAAPYLLPIILIIVDLVLAYLIWQQRDARRGDADATVETRRTV